MEAFLSILHKLPFILLFRSTASGRQSYTEELRSSQSETQKAEEPRLTNPKPQSAHQRKRLGVWELVYISRSRFSELNWFQSTFLKNVRMVRENWLVVLRFMEETYEIAPKETMCYLLHNFWNSLQGSLSLYATSRLVDLVSYGSSVLSCILTYKPHFRLDRA